MIKPILQSVVSDVISAAKVDSVELWRWNGEITFAAAWDSLDVEGERAGDINALSEGAYYRVTGTYIGSGSLEVRIGDNNTVTVNGDGVNIDKQTTNPSQSTRLLCVPSTNDAVGGLVNLSVKEIK